MNKIKNLYDKKGFTLIEIITSIVVLSILGTIVGMGFVSAINGYFIAKGNTDTVQNAEIILARLAKEINSTGSITSGNQTSLTFCTNSTYTYTAANPVCPPSSLLTLSSRCCGARLQHGFWRRPSQVRSPLWRVARPLPAARPGS